MRPRPLNIVHDQGHRFWPAWRLGGPGEAGAVEHDALAFVECRLLYGFVGFRHVVEAASFVIARDLVHVYNFFLDGVVDDIHLFIAAKQWLTIHLPSANFNFTARYHNIHRILEVAILLFALEKLNWYQCMPYISISLQPRFYGMPISILPTVIWSLTNHIEPHLTTTWHYSSCIIPSANLNQTWDSNWNLMLYLVKLLKLDLRVWDQVWEELVHTANSNQEPLRVRSGWYRPPTDRPILLSTSQFISIAVFKLRLRGMI